MRVLYLQTFPFWGSGSGTYARHLAAEIGKRHEVAIMAPDERSVDNTNVYTVKLPFRVAFTGHPEWPNCILYQGLEADKIDRIHRTFQKCTIEVVNKFKPDIIHVHHVFPLSWSTSFVKDTYGTPYVVTVHGSELPTLENDKRYYPQTYDAMKRARCIIPNSRYTRDWFNKVFKDEFKRKCRVIPGGVDVGKFKYTKKGFDLINRTFGVKNKRVVLFAGKLTKYKGVEFLIKAASRIHGEVVILGDGPDKKRLQDIARKTRANNIHWQGHLGAGVKLLAPYYSRADVLVVPSVWDEPLGLVILEAMACKTPVVVTRKGGIPLAVKDGVNGLFVRARNSTDIAEKVNSLLDNNERRIKIGNNARRIVEEKFCWKVIGNKFERLYQKHSNNNEK